MHVLFLCGARTPHRPSPWTEAPARLIAELRHLIHAFTQVAIFEAKFHHVFGLAFKIPSGLGCVIPCPRPRTHGISRNCLVLILPKSSYFPEIRSLVDSGQRKKHLRISKAPSPGLAGLWVGIRYVCYFFPTQFRYQTASPFPLWCI